MKNKFKLVETEDYLLAVSDEEIKEGDLYIGVINGCLKIKQHIFKSGYNPLLYEGDKKIIAYQPKGNAPELDLLLLPDVEEDVDKLFIEKSNIPYFPSDLKETCNWWFKEGYKSATKKYSEEDLRKAYYQGRKEAVNSVTNKLAFISPDDYIQFLKQPKWFVAEMKCGRCYIPLKDDDCWSAKECSRNSKNDLLLTTTINGKTYLVGTYLHS
jgi:hypothetical protein